MKIEVEIEEKTKTNKVIEITNRFIKNCLNQIMIIDENTCISVYIGQDTNRAEIQMYAAKIPLSFPYQESNDYDFFNAYNEAQKRILHQLSQSETNIDFLDKVKDARKLSRENKIYRVILAKRIPHYEENTYTRICETLEDFAQYSKFLCEITNTDIVSFKKL